MNSMTILKNVESERARATFYPTPEALADKLLEGIDWNFVQSVLEPSAGKGDLANVVVKRQHNRYRFHGLKDEVGARKACDIDCIEIDPVLRQMLEAQGFRVVHDDFLTYETQKRYDLIVMNPPFDQGDRHLLKALQLADRGGSIRCILNAETIRNPFSTARQELVKLFDKYGATIRYESGAFAHAERRTDVDVALVSVDIPKVKRDSTLLNELRKAPPYKTAAIPEEYSEIVRYNQIDEMVNRYNFEVASGIRIIEEYEAMKRLLPEEIGIDHGFEISVHTFEVDGRQGAPIPNQYIRRVRGKYWRMIFQRPIFTEKLTANLLNQLRDSVNELMDYEFSAYNILTMLMKMNQQVSTGIEQTILNLFDDWTGTYHWSPTTSNRHYFDGWATNDCFRVGKKVILPFVRAYDSWDGSFRSYYIRDKFRDIEKVFDFLDCGRTEWEGTIDDVLNNAEKTKNAKNVDTKYFTVTFFKKGTAHLVFKDMELLEKFNLFAGQRKGWLPPNYGKKRYKDMTKAEQHVVDSFQGREQYEKIMDNAAYYLDAGQPQMMMLGAGNEAMQ